MSSFTDRFRRPSPWAARFPAPAQAWTEEYQRRHQELVVAALGDRAHVAAIARGDRLGPGYGAGFDERVIEFPWLLGAGPGGRTLDAGSTLNHSHVLDAVLPLVDELTITTLAPEPQAYPERGVSYVFADLRELPFRNDWFDTTVSLSTLEHVGMDTSVYGTAAGRAADPEHETRLAVQELIRVTRPGGQILISVPFGRHEDHGWMRQLDACDLSRLVSTFAPRPVQIVLYGYSARGWERASAEAVADARYKNYFTDGSPAEDLAAAARAVACVSITV